MLTQLSARENIIEFIRHECFKTYIDSTGSRQAPMAKGYVAGN